MYSNNDYRYYSESELYHHGIIGQKWGIRRYQNEDGSLTDEGRKHYGYKESAKNDTTDSNLKTYEKPFMYSKASLTKQAKEAIENGAKNYKPGIDRIKAVTASMLTESDINQRGFLTRDSYSVIKAADVGLKAINRVRDADDEDIYYYMDSYGWDKKKATEYIEMEDRWWFIYEDQTIGLYSISDLVVNQGFSSKEVSKMIDIVNENYDIASSNGDWEEAYDTSFFIQESNYNNLNKNFAKRCESILKENRKK